MVRDQGLGALGVTGNLAVAGMGQGTLDEMDMQDQMRRQAEALRAEGEADRKKHTTIFSVATGPHSPEYLLACQQEGQR